MARVTVEDCLQQVENQYDLVLLAKERTFQLISGAEPLLPKDNDKRTVIALREIAEKKVSTTDLEHSAINKLRKYPEGEEDESDDLSDVEDDEFQKVYKGQVSKSGMAVLPSKRSRNTNNNLVVEKNVLKEIKTDTETETKDSETETKDSETETKDTETETKDSETETKDSETDQSEEIPKETSK